MLALAVAVAARRARALTTSGALAAVAVGTIAVAAGWGWAALLIFYFLSSSLLSRLGAERKERRTASVVEKGGARDGVQVLVNGGVFAAAALASLFLAHPLFWRAAGAGALAAAAADTWATEIGTWIGGTPRSAWNWRRVPPGTSGGMTAAGTTAMLLGAIAIAALALALGWGHGTAWGAVTGGVAGGTADTVIGARFQERRRCLGCGEYTERLVHTCGSRSRRARGIPGLDNDVVNLLASLVGGGLAYKVAELVAP